MSGSRHIWPSIVFLMTRQPWTVPALSKQIGSHPDHVRRNLQKLAEEGLVTRKRSGRAAEVWTWSA